MFNRSKFCFSVVTGESILNIRNDYNFFYRTSWKIPTLPPSQLFKVTFEFPKSSYSQKLWPFLMVKKGFPTYILTKKSHNFKKKKCGSLFWYFKKSHNLKKKSAETMGKYGALFDFLEGIYTTSWHTVVESYLRFLFRTIT